MNNGHKSRQTTNRSASGLVGVLGSGSSRDELCNLSLWAVGYARLFIRAFLGDTSLREEGHVFVGLKGGIEDAITNGVKELDDVDFDLLLRGV